MVIVAVLLLFGFTRSVIAQAAASPAPTPSPNVMEVQYEKVNPNGGFGYIQKRLGEKVKLLFLSLSTESKENYYKELAGVRLAELKYVIVEKDLANFEKTTIRYSTTVGEWAEFISNKQLNDKKASAVYVMSQHLPVVEQLMTKYDGTTAEWRFVKQDADYLKIYSSKLQN